MERGGHAPGDLAPRPLLARADPRAARLRIRFRPAHRRRHVRLRDDDRPARGAAAHAPAASLARGCVVDARVDRRDGGGGGGRRRPDRDCGRHRGHDCDGAPRHRGPARPTAKLGPAARGLARPYLGGRDPAGGRRHRRLLGRAGGDRHRAHLCARCRIGGARVMSFSLAHLAGRAVGAPFAARGRRHHCDSLSPRLLLAGARLRAGGWPLPPSAVQRAPGGDRHRRRGGRSRPRAGGGHSPGVSR